ncbi:MAG: biotin-dependent carboxyltransferase family protein [Hyphomicrobiaceae bacterium]
MTGGGGRPAGALVILRCGHATTIQDAGRPGFARLGLAPGGAMDRRALHAANALVGNAPDEAAIECAFLGLEVRLEGGPARLALAGARARMRVNDVPVADHTSFVMQDGDRLVIGRADGGMYVMLAVAGGLDVPMVLASRSTDLRAGIGGLEGRALRPGDRIVLRTVAGASGPQRVTCPVALAETEPVRIVAGPQWEMFGEPAHEALLTNGFVVSHAVDRMACRLVGPPLSRAVLCDMISEPTTPGAMQVPPDGAPLIMMADRQTIGGYPRIACVISADLERLAQRPPGAQIRFTLVTIEEAEAAARSRRAWRPTVHPLRDAALLDLECVGDAAVSALAAETWDHLAPTGS